jgi:hypothetical protein
MQRLCQFDSERNPPSLKFARRDRPIALMGVNFAPFGNRVDAGHFRNGAMN